MGLDNPVLREFGAGLNEITDKGETYIEVDEGIDPDDESDEPDDCSSQNSTTEKETNITIQEISFYSSEKILATPQDLSLKPGTHLPEEDKAHRISAGFLTRISDIDLQTVLGWARTQDVFLKLEFHLTGNDFPRFTTRVKVVEDQQEDISLSGGLRFALRLLKFVKIMDLKAPASRKLPWLPPIRKGGHHHWRAGNQRQQKIVGPRRQPRSFYLSDLERLDRIREYQAACLPSQTAPPPLSSSLPSLADMDDQDSVSSFSDQTYDSLEAPPLTIATTAPSWHDADPGYPWSFGSSPANSSEAHIAVSGLKALQVPIDPFEQQKRRAEAMYKESGDTSGLVSVMNLATAQPLSNRSASYWCPPQN